MNKSLLTHIIASIILIASFFLQEPFKEYFYYASLFALSGALTNHLAIYMLFHKVPFLYGSGVIELNFQKFKTAIKELIMKEFFAKEKVEHFIENEYKEIDFTKIVETIDYSQVFQALKEGIMESKFGQLINMFGGEETLNGLKEPFINKLKQSLMKLTNSSTFKEEVQKQLTNSNISEHFLKKIDIIIQKRLDELSAKEVRNIIENLMKKHLEWLVVWGALFGGLIGLCAPAFA